MKICFDNEIFWTQEFGAISSRYFFNLIKNLSTKKNLDVKVSVLARGIPVGDQLEYTDEVTLARSIQNRRPYESNLSNH